MVEISKLLRFGCVTVTYSDTTKTQLFKLTIKQLKLDFFDLIVKAVISQFSGHEESHCHIESGK